MREVYGKSVTIDGYCEPTEDVLSPLVSPTILADLLIKIVKGIGMRILQGPVTGLELDKSLEDNGPSAVVLLQESHAAIHCYPFRGRFFLDVFSCKPFDPRTIIATLQESGLVLLTFQLKSNDRGRDWDTLPKVRKLRDDHENTNCSV